MIRDLAIDLGSANTLVWVRGEGVVLRQPTVVAVEPRPGRVRAFGAAAFEAIVASHGQLVLERPVRGGTVTDFATTTSMLRLVLEAVGVRRLSRSRVIVAAPSGSTAVERRALTDALRRAGAARAYVMEEGLAAAIGAGLPVHEPVGCMIADIGGGSTEVAVVSLGGVVVARTARVGGFDLDMAIQDAVRERFDLAVGDRTAEDLKVTLGSAHPAAAPGQAEVRGRDLSTGEVRSVALDSEDVRVAMEGGVAEITAAVIGALSECPPELAHDVMQSGLVLVGGGALLSGLDARLAAESQVAVTVGADPLDAVIRGLGQSLESGADLAALFDTG